MIDFYIVLAITLISLLAMFIASLKHKTNAERALEAWKKWGMIDEEGADKVLPLMERLMK